MMEWIVGRITARPECIRCGCLAQPERGNVVNEGLDRDAQKREDAEMHSKEETTTTRRKNDDQTTIRCRSYRGTFSPAPNTISFSRSQSAGPATAQARFRGEGGAV